MRNNFDVIDIVYSYLKPFETELSGGLYKMKRPFNSKKEDIVINTLAINDEDAQRVTVNVNIHVPDLFVNIDGIEQKQPNFKRLQELVTKITPTIQEVYKDDYNFWIEWQQVIQDQAIADNHYCNIRLVFKSHKSYFFN